MKMHLDTSESNLVTDYGENFISVNSRRYDQAVVVSKDQLHTDWPDKEIRELELNDFAAVLATNPELIVLGTGKAHKFAHPRLATELHAKGCALEVMNTGAACRTYNVLISERREVTAVLLPIKDV